MSTIASVCVVVSDCISVIWAVKDDGGLFLVETLECAARGDVRAREFAAFLGVPVVTKDLRTGRQREAGAAAVPVVKVVGFIDEKSVWTGETVNPNEGVKQAFPKGRW